MAKYADLEIGLHRRDAGLYAVEFRFSQPDSEADIRLSQVTPAVAQIDLDELRSLAFDSSAYGEALTQGLFSDPDVQSAFAQARASSRSLDVPMRLRLLIGPSAPELHGLRWENLLDPLDHTSLCTSEDLYFSRYLSSLDWRPVRLRPKGKLSALVVVSNPTNLADYKLAPVDVEGEIERARQGLGAIQVATLPGSSSQHATLAGILACLREGYSILYLVCHGALVKDEPWIWLEDEQGQVDRVCGTDLVIRLKELQQRPSLVVLASCQSAAQGAGDALSALGPRLAEAGIPAVIAMQGNITMQTVAKFMPTFFEQLQRDGQIDRALAVARGAIRDRPDSWMPALFMRLKSGRIWYVPGFADDRKGFEKWPALVRSIKRGQCTPILGPGLLEPLFGSQREVAQRWAETYHYPMAPHERESLPQVAQFLSVNQDHSFPYDELGEYLRQEIQNRYEGDLPPELRQGSPALDLLIEAVGAKWRKQDDLEAHRVIAQLPVPLFITTNPDNLLGSALTEAGKDPQVLICPWNEYAEQVETIFDREPGYRPTPERPLVYHLLGRLNEPDSVVLTEDDYFDFLIGVTSNKDLIPSTVRRALADTALLFLGFQMDDWNFRVLFRTILSQQGGSRRDRYAHIAAQIEPEEGRILEPERARRYLDNYFYKGADISIFWGSAEDFVKELAGRLNEGVR